MTATGRPLGEWLSMVLTGWGAVVFMLLWAGLAVALLTDPNWLDRTWSWIDSLPPVPKVVVWVLFLPITVTLWIWQSPWPNGARMAAFAAIVVWTALAASSLLRLLGR